MLSMGDIDAYLDPDERMQYMDLVLSSQYGVAGLELRAEIEQQVRDRKHAAKPQVRGWLTFLRTHAGRG